MWCAMSHACPKSEQPKNLAFCKILLIMLRICSAQIAHTYSFLLIQDLWLFVFNDRDAFLSVVNLGRWMPTQCLDERLMLYSPSQMPLPIFTWDPRLGSWEGMKTIRAKRPPVHRKWDLNISDVVPIPGQQVCWSEEIDNGAKLIILYISYG